MPRQENSYASFTVSSEDGGVHLDVTLIESGFFPVPRDLHFDHPNPPFDRVFLFRRGGARVQLETAVRPVLLTPRRLYLLPAGQTFAVDYQGGSEFFFFHVVVEDDLGLRVFHGQRGVPVLGADETRVDDLLDFYDRPGLDAHLRWQTALFLALVRFFGPHAHEHSELARRSMKHRDVLTAVRRECRHGLSVKELASRAGVSPGALSKSFRRDVGIPLKDYILHETMRQAGRLLAESDLSVKQVSSRLGYPDPAYFNRIFRRVMRQTPLAYRHTVRWRTPLDRHRRG